MKMLTTITFIFFISNALHSDVISVKMGTLAPEGSTWLEMWKKIAGEIEAKSNNTIKILTYPGGVLGDEIDMLRLMKLDQLQIGGFTVLGIAKAVPEMQVLELPFLFRNYEEIDHIRDKMFSDFQKFFEKRGFVLLSWVDQGFVKIYSKKDTNTFEKLKQTKMWVWSGEEMAIETFKTLGISPIPLPVPDVFTALQAGIIDTIYTTPLACVALQWCNNISYTIDINLRYEAGAIIGTQKYWKGLNETQKRLTVETNNKYLKEVLNAIREDQNKAFDELKKRTKVIKFSNEEMKKIEEEGKKLWFELADKVYPREILDKILKNLEDYRKGVKH